MNFNANYNIDLEELHNNILNDFNDITNVEKCLDSAENLGVDLGIFSNICSIFTINQLNDIVPKEQTKNIDKNDKYIIETLDLKFYSTNKDLKKELKKIAEKTYKIIIEKIKNKEFKEVLNNYMLEAIDLSLIEKQ